MVKTAFDYGTMFSIEVDHREYWITAKHLLTGAKAGPGTLKSAKFSASVLDAISPEPKWVPVEFTVLDPGKDIDIVVLVPPQPIQQVPIPPLPVASVGVPIGGECEFLGFPFALALPSKYEGLNYRMPVIKHCYISGTVPEPIRTFVLDGLNNVGFSGGPVIAQTGTAQVIFGVISGFISEPSDVISVPETLPPQGQKPTSVESAPNKSEKRKNVVNLNSGIVFATDATYALEAIKKNPIGPVVQNK